MDINELNKTLENRKKGISYKMWKQSNLTGLMFNDPKKFPANPELASPELHPPKVTIKMPDFLKEKYYKRKFEGR